MYFGWNVCGSDCIRVCERQWGHSGQQEGPQAANTGLARYWNRPEVFNSSGVHRIEEQARRLCAGRSHTGFIPQLMPT
jgi:hypothetical protein